MASASRRQFLQSLCYGSPWDYAVFWSFQQHQGQTLLTWDDGVSDISRPIGHKEDVMGSAYVHCYDERLFPLALLLEEMSNIHYVMGKGVVGEVAHTETSHWIYADTIMSGEFSSNSIPQCPGELLNQFIAGVKSILLVPLVPYGVLQLGSLDKVAEDAELVNCVKKKFDADQQFSAYASLFSSEKRFLTQSPAYSTAHTDNSVDLFGNAMDRANKGLKVISDVVQGGRMLSKDLLMMKKVPDNGSERKIRAELGGPVDVKEHLSYPLYEGAESDMKLKFSGSSYLDEELDVFSYFNDDEMMHGKISIDQFMESIPHGLTGDPAVVNDCDYPTFKSGRQFLTFPSDCELHKALGSSLPDHSDMGVPCSNFSNTGGNFLYDENSIHGSQPLVWSCDGRADEGKKVEDLLETVLAIASSITDHSSSNRSSTSSSKASPGKFESCDIAHVSSAGEDQFPCITSAFSMDNNSRGETAPSNSKSSFDSVQRKRNDSLCASKGLKLTGSNKKRVRPGENQKARPRDRQLIQDRIKELRGLVPNSAKCSIDSLLERTIKHMQFLRSVSDQADKVRPHMVNKSSEHMAFKSPVAKSNDQNGTSWAVELDGEQQACPIVVKDLEYPGHMLIEMLCSDHGRFLEIADVIHRLDLTILKGLMEKRSDECTWAHFVVEASGSFHRLDIFWPLMKLLQQNRTQISSRI